jgi:hypothetical protein
MYLYNPRRYTVTVSFFPGSNRLAEIFLGNGRAGSDIDAAAKDSAVVASIALQYGVPLHTIRRALMRDARGAASGLLGCALDLLAAMDVGAAMTRGAHDQRAHQHGAIKPVKNRSTSAVTDDEINEGGDAATSPPLKRSKPSKRHQEWRMHACSADQLIKKPTTAQPRVRACGCVRPP